MEDGNIKYDKLVFLDVNGVLDSHNHNIEMGILRKTPYYDKHFFDWNCLYNLYKLIEATDANIVVSSEWRHVKKLMRRLLKYLAIYDLDQKVIGKTPRVKVENNGWSKVDRGKEIEKFLKKNPCNEFVVLDDINWDLKHFGERLIHTSCTHGLVEEDVEKAIAILNRRKDKTLQK